MKYNDLQKGIYVLHENKEWIPPFIAAFKRAQANGKIPKDVIFGEILLTSGNLSVESPPPKGVFWSRLSASSHTRGNVYSKEFGRALLAHLEAHNRRVINGLSVLEFEVSKIRQYLALNDAGFRTPRTIAVFNKNDLLEVAKALPTPFITKHNQGGKGLGVKRFDNLADFKSYVESSAFEEAVDGITLLQEYIPSKAPFITRLEFIGGRFCYAVRVDTSSGAFELCPADSCDIERTNDVQDKIATSGRLDSGSHTKADSSLPEIAGAMCELPSHKFSIREDITAKTPIVTRLEAFIKAHNIEVAGVEFIDTPKNEIVIYDINTNTNYNSKLEDSLRAKGEVGAADRVVEFLYKEFLKT